MARSGVDRARILKDDALLFLRARLPSALTLGFAVASAAYLIAHYFRYGRTPGFSSVVDPLRTVLSLSIYLFAIFLIASYEFLSKPDRVQIDEALSATSSGRLCLFAPKFVILMFCGLAITAFCILYAVVAFCVADVDAPRGPYLFHIVKCVFVYTFLVCLCAISTGAAISLIRKRLLALATVLLSVLLVSPLFGAVATTVLLTSDVNIFPLLNFFDILPVNLNWRPNFSAGFMVLPDKVCLIAFWICAMLSVCLYGLCGTRRRAVSGVGIALCVLALIGYALPLSTVRMNDDPNGTAMHDQYYYATNPGRDEPADYRITAYNMKIEIGRILRAEAGMSFDTEQDSYRMTLYHGYEITEVRDQSGAALAFRREGDYLTIDGGDGTKKIVIS
jgi:hypothetical protein